MRKKIKKGISCLAVLAMLFSVWSIPVFAQPNDNETHSILTWTNDGKVTVEQYSENIWQVRQQRVKHAYLPNISDNNIYKKSLQTTRGLITSQEKVNTQEHPYCAVGYLEAYFDWDQDGSIEDADRYSPITSTAFLEAEDIVLTAAHAVYSRQLDAWAQKVLFYPGYDKERYPYTVQTSSLVIEISIGTDYVNGVDYSDWAICQIADDFGSSRGWLGLSTSPEEELEVTLAGYPGNDEYVDVGCQYITHGEIIEVVNEKFFYSSNYSFHGYSGGPIYYSGGLVIGIAAVSAGDSSANVNTGATAFPDWLFDMILEKCDESAERWG